jgi:hypothetical protein
VTSTLALLGALALPCLVGGEAHAASAQAAPAKAESHKDTKPAPSKETAAEKPAKHAEGRGKDAKDAALPSAHKAHGKGGKKAGRHHAAAAEKAAGGKKTKKVASRSNNGGTKPASFKPGTEKPSNDKPAAGSGKSGKKKSAKKGDGETPRPACHPATVSIDRNGLESETFALLDCKGEPLDSARVHLSVLARPWGAQRPAAPVMAKVAKKLGAPAKKTKKGEPPAVITDVAPNVRLLDPGLLSRVDTIAKHFPGKSVSLVSGYRPQSRGSLHQAARALDMRVAGVANEELVAYCKTLKDTGCGYYPNSSFVHVDVRLPGTGSVSWIDASGPGETPRYVTQWPPPPEPAPAETAKSAGGNTPPVVPPADEINDETPRGGDAASKRDHAEPEQVRENDPRDEALEAEKKASSKEKAEKVEAKDKAEAKEAPAKPSAAPSGAGQGKSAAAARE